MVAKASPQADPSLACPPRAGRNRRPRRLAAALVLAAVVLAALVSVAPVPAWAEGGPGVAGVGQPVIERVRTDPATLGAVAAPEVVATPEAVARRVATHNLGIRAGGVRVGAAELRFVGAAEGEPRAVGVLEIAFKDEAGAVRAERALAARRGFFTGTLILTPFRYRRDRTSIVVVWTEQGGDAALVERLDKLLP